MPLHLGPLFSLLCAAAGVDKARNARPGDLSQRKIVVFLFAASGEQVAVIYSVTFSNKRGSL
jgi:hypothetical protein